MDLKFQEGKGPEQSSSKPIYRIGYYQDVDIQIKSEFENDSPKKYAFFDGDQDVILCYLIQLGMAYHKVNVSAEIEYLKVPLPKDIDKITHIGQPPYMLTPIEEFKSNLKMMSQESSYVLNTDPQVSIYCKYKPNPFTKLDKAISEIEKDAYAAQMALYAEQLPWLPIGTTNADNDVWASKPVYPEDEHEKVKEQYLIAKAAKFSKIYGGGPENKEQGESKPGPMSEKTGLEPVTDPYTGKTDYVPKQSFTQKYPPKTQAKKGKTKFKFNPKNESVTPEEAPELRFTVIANLPHVVLYDNKDLKRYDIVFDDSNLPDYEREFKWPDWPEVVISRIMPYLPPMYITKWNKPLYSQGDDAQSWSSHPVFQKQVQHPLNSSRTDTITNIIISLNDSQKWTREKIADWLETLDAQPTFELDFEEVSDTPDETTYRVPKLATVVAI